MTFCESGGARDLIECAVVFFGDESGVRSDFHAGTTWGIRGKNPCYPSHWQTLHPHWLGWEWPHQVMRIGFIAQPALVVGGQ